MTVLLTKCAELCRKKSESNRHVVLILFSLKANPSKPQIPSIMFSNIHFVKKSEYLRFPTQDSAPA